MYSYTLLVKSILANNLRYGSKTAIVSNNQAVSYQELSDNIFKAAEKLYELGVRHGDNIILTAKKELDFVYIYFGAHIIGATNVIIDADSNQERFNYIKRVTEPKCCLGYNSTSIDSYSFESLDIENTPLFNCEGYSENVLNDDIAEIMFTTGTTGAPKGVCLSYFNIYSSALNINSYIGNNSSDVEVLALPLCHSFGLGRLRCNLLIGSTIIFLGSFTNVKLLFNTLNKYKATFLGLVPAAWEYIKRISGKRISAFSNQIKYIEIGSAPMSHANKIELLTIFPSTKICMHYGLTEASRSTFIEFHDLDHIESIGKPVCDKVEIKIINDEICVKGNMVMRYYLGMPRLTDDSFIDGYFRTGDCGHIENDGYLYLDGREKEMINVGGKKVSPNEVEDAICELGIEDCICIGIPDPKGIMGEVVKAFILKTNSTLSFDDISRQLVDRLEAYKRPVEYDWINVIPKTSSGKKQRKLIQQK